MTPYTIRNHVKTTLFVGIGNVDTSFSIVAASSPFNNPPAPSAGRPGVLTMTDNMAAPTKIEHITYSGISDNGDGTLTLTGVTRGAESTPAQSWTAGALIFQAPTQGLLNLDAPWPASLGGTGLSSLTTGSFIRAASTSVFEQRTATQVRGDISAATAGAITGSGLTIATARIAGRTTSSTGALEEIAIGAGLVLAAGVLSFNAAAAAITGGTITGITSLGVNGNATVAGVTIGSASGNGAAGNTLSSQSANGNYVARFLNAAGVTQAGFAFENSGADFATYIAGAERSRLTAAGFRVAGLVRTSSQLEIGDASGDSAHFLNVSNSSRSARISVDPANTGAGTQFDIWVDGVERAKWLADVWSLAGVLSATKGTIGDVVTWRGASGSKTGYLFSDNGYIGFGDGANGAGNGFLIGEGTPKVYAIINGAAVTTTQAGSFAVTGASSCTGNTGVGAAPRTDWISSRRAIEISGNTVATLSLGSAISEVLHNLYVSGTLSNFAYSTAAPAGACSFNNAVAAGWSWAGAAAGTAGSAASLAQWMQLTSAGLDISGNITNNGVHDVVTGGITTRLQSSAGDARGYVGTVSNHNFGILRQGALKFETTPNGTHTYGAIDSTGTQFNVYTGANNYEMVNRGTGHWLFYTDSGSKLPFIIERFAPTGAFGIRGDGYVEAKVGYCYEAETDDGVSGATKTIDWPSRHRRKLTISANTTLTFTSPGKPCSLILKVITDTSSGATQTISWPASIKWAGGITPNHMTGNSKTHIFAFYFDGTNYFGSAMLDCA